MLIPPGIGVGMVLPAGSGIGMAQVGVGAGMVQIWIWTEIEIWTGIATESTRRPSSFLQRLLLSLLSALSDPHAPKLRPLGLCVRQSMSRLALCREIDQPGLEGSQEKEHMQALAFNSSSQLAASCPALPTGCN